MDAGTLNYYYRMIDNLYYHKREKKIPEMSGIF